MRFYNLLIPVFILLFNNAGFTQDDLMQLLEEETEDQGPQPVTSIFKATRLVNGHTVEINKARVLQFIISHRFGNLNTGAYHFFGLDESNIRLGLEYGISEKVNIGIGRSSFDKTFDGFVKYKFVEQSKGNNSFPFSGALFGSAAVNSLRVTDPGFDYTITHRTVYTTQILLARKFNNTASFQIVPTWVHKNLVQTRSDNNDIFTVGFGGRIGITQSLDITAEYHLQLNPNESFINYNSVGLGVDIETGGHVFQLVLTNSRPMIEKGFITETRGDVSNGDIRFGFNIVRRFQLGSGGRSW